MHLNEFGNNILDQIIYRGEGNSSIVIALKDQAKVIRLLKKDGKIMKSNHDHHVTHHPLRSIKFIHFIMKPLTDPYLSGTTELIHLKSDFINLLSKRVEVYRPLHRLDKTLLLDDQYALVMDDLCTLPHHITKSLNDSDLCGPIISVEIKPKQGFLPIYKSAMKPSTTNDQLAIKMKNCCIYGLNQNLKLNRGRIQQTSDYCPINLFSGCPSKMKIALEELIHNPQNNLRIFKDLTLAYGESNQVKLSSILDDFFNHQYNDHAIDGDYNYKSTNSYENRIIDLLIQCLLSNLDGKIEDFHDTTSASSKVGVIGDPSLEPESSQPTAEDENSYSIRDVCLQHSPRIRCRYCDNQPSDFKYKLPSHKLPKSCVLACVLKAQKLDTIGAHEALHMLEWLIESGKDETTGGDILEELNRPHLPNGFGSTHQLSSESKQQYHFRKVWEFLVSLTAKDCSIIVTLRQISPDRHESIIKNYPELRKQIIRDRYHGNYYLFNVGIADLDQKMPLKIPRICENLNLLQQSKSDYVKKETLSSQQLQSNLKILVKS